MGDATVQVAAGKTDSMKTSSIRPRRSCFPLPADHSPPFVTRTESDLDIRRTMRDGALRAKLTIGPPDDEYEREADRVADQVMRMEEPAVQRSPG